MKINKVIFGFIIFVVFITAIHGQKLSVPEVCNYIESNFHHYDKKIKVIVETDGYIRMKIFSKNRIDNYAESDYGFSYHDVKDIESIQIYGDYYIILNMLKSPDMYNLYSDCLRELDNKTIGNSKAYTGIRLSCIKDQRQVSKVKNALSYLVEELKYDPKYNQNDSDPFSDYNYHRLKNKISSSRTEYKIKLLKENGVYTLPIKLSGITVGKAILDSGASDITISKNIEDELIRQGKISKSSYLSPALYKIADGSIIQANRFILPEITIDDLKVPNVICSVMVNNSSDILLGQGFLKRFTSWQLDNLTSTLILKP